MATQNPAKTPGDEAFKALADSDDKAVQALLADSDKMAEVLKYHIVPGATLTGARIVKLIEDNKGKLSFKTSQGERINATLVDGSVNVNGGGLDGGRGSRGPGSGQAVAPAWMLPRRTRACWDALKPCPPPPLDRRARQGRGRAGRQGDDPHHRRRAGAAVPGAQGQEGRRQG